MFLYKYKINMFLTSKDLVEYKNKSVIFLRHKNIKEVDENTFIPYEKLRELSLYNNKLSSLNFIKNLNCLTSLLLANNNLSFIDRNIFKKLTSLEYLSLSFNNITKINKNTFNSLTLLKCLLLNNNKLTKLHKNTFNSLTLLDTLNIRNNNLNYIDKKNFIKPQKMLFSCGNKLSLKFFVKIFDYELLYEYKKYKKNISYYYF
jgi:Leucine-rich repeat (LRR) protein